MSDKWINRIGSIILLALVVWLFRHLGMSTENIALAVAVIAYMEAVDKS